VEALFSVLCFCHFGRIIHLQERRREYANDDPANDTCTILPKEGRTIVTFEKKRIRSDSTYTDSVTAIVPTNLRVGTYTVTLSAWDGYEQRAQVFAQPNERYFVEFLADGTVIARSGDTSDLEDFVQDAKVTEVVNSALKITQAVSGVRGVHSVYPDATNPNSLYPVCAAFDLHAPVVIEEPEPKPDPKPKPAPVVEEPEVVEEEPIIVQCASDHRICSDGSLVYRQLPECRFAQCPVVPVAAPKPAPVAVVAEEPTQVPVQTEDATEVTPILSPAEAQALLDRLRATTQPSQPRQPTVREAVVIEERRQVLETPPKELRRFNPAERTERVRRERLRRGLAVDDIEIIDETGSILRSQIDDLIFLVERESGERVDLAAPRRDVVAEERTDPLSWVFSD
jgi:hypothetical protein